MFSLHLLKTEWMAYPELIIDIYIGKASLSSILARGGDICVGIFAFISGYGWATTYSNRSLSSRVFGIGGYHSYWIVLFIFAFPIRFLMEYILCGELIHITFRDFVLSILAIRSPSIRLIALSFGYLIRLIDYIPVNGWISIVVVCVISFMLRIVSQIAFTRIFAFENLHEIFSHYFQWMPVVMTGYIVKRDLLYDKLYHRLSLAHNRVFNIMCILLCSVLYIGKCFFQHYSKVYSNFDSFYISIFMFELIGIARWIHDKQHFLSKLLSYLGGISLYLWLSHRVLLYPPIQWVILHCRIPVFIIFLCFVIMVPIALLLKKIDLKFLATSK